MFTLGICYTNIVALTRVGDTTIIAMLYIYVRSIFCMCCGVYFNSRLFELIR